MDYWRLLIAFLIVAVVFGASFGGEDFRSITGEASKKLFGSCNQIKDGNIKYRTPSCGTIIPQGYDKWGHNYENHVFKGKYCDNYCGEDWCRFWADIDLEMKWSDDWLSSADCDKDGFLDKPNKQGAWTTNTLSGTYEMDGKTCKWSWKTKLIYWPDTEACKAAGGIPDFGEYCRVQSIYNDPCGGEHGKELLVKGAGLGTAGK